MVTVVLILALFLPHHQLYKFQIDWQSTSRNIGYPYVRLALKFFLVRLVASDETERSCIPE